MALPLNVMLFPGLAPVAELRAWGVRRVSGGGAVAYPEMNALFAEPAAAPARD